jgi:eukaryotic-like serine/threonine-protein kinase
VPGPDDGQQRRIGGRYLLSTLLGSGAMGTVWSGYDEVLQRRVAVKELKVPPGVPAHEARDMRERIMREARALGGLSHPNIITVFDVVVVDGAPVVVLEMVPSRDLATMIADHGALSLSQAAVIGFTTAGALRAAHRSGITHRDVKPGNVLVADDGRVKLTDFGIARNVADAPMTSAGLVLGSPAYIAPEVAAGQPVTTAADLWGLGATLFAAIEGRPPYDVQGDPVRTITEVVDGEVPQPRITGPVAEVIAALMVKDPDRRMRLEEVRHRLRPLILDPDDPVYPGSPDAPTMASPITLRPVGGGSAATGRPPRPAPRPGPTDTGPPSLIKSGDARPGSQSAPPAAGQPPSPTSGGRPRTGTGSDAHPRPGTGTGGHPRPARPAEPTPGTRSGPQAAAAPAPLAAAPGPLPAELRSLESRSPESRSPESRPPESRPPEPRSPEPRPLEPRSPEPRSSEPRRASPPAADTPAAPPPASRPTPSALAASPGPLPPDLRMPAGPTAPGRPRTEHQRPPTGAASGWVAAGLVVAGAAVVLAGIAAGWTVTRSVSGQSPWSTVTISTPGSP